MATELEKRDQSLTKPCAHCGKPMTAAYPSSLKRRKFCSRRCSGLASAPSHPRGATHPRYVGGIFQSRGRWYVVLRNGTNIPYARAVAEAKLGRHLTRDEVVHHLNGLKYDDRPENLEVISQSTHWQRHREDLLEGLRRFPWQPQHSAHPRKLTREDALAIREASGTQQEIADRYGVSQTLVHQIKARKAWAHV